MSAADLAQYVRAPERDMARVTEVYEAATSMVGRLVGDTTVVPATVKDQAVLATGANLYARRTSQTELGSYDNQLLQSVPQRPALDPLTPARAMLAPYLGPGIA